MSALAAVVKAAAVAERELPFDLRLEQDRFELDQSLLAPVIVDPNRVPPPLPQAEPPPPAGALSARQLQGLAAALAVAAPSGVIALPDAAGVIAKRAPEDAGKGLPAELWAPASRAALEAMLAAGFDPSGSGYVDWRQLVASLAAATVPAVAAGSVADLLSSRDVLLAAAAATKGRLTADALAAARLWFDRELQPGEYDREAQLKQALFAAFALPPPPPAEGQEQQQAEDEGPCVEPLTLLLYLAARPAGDLRGGLARGLALLGAGEDGATPEQLLRLAYPSGAAAAAAVGRAPVDLPAIEHAVRAIRHLTVPGTAAAEQAESAGGEKLLLTLDELLSAPEAAALRQAVARYALTDPAELLKVSSGA